MLQKVQVAGIIDQRIEKTGISVAYPEIVGLNILGVQAGVNAQIKAAVRKMMVAQGSEAAELVQMEGSYTVEINEKGLLSIRFENYARKVTQGSGRTLLKALTFDLATGVLYSFKDLFNPHLPYHDLLNSLIQEQIRQKSLPTTGPVPGVADDQDFYLMRSSMVIIFPELIFTPHVLGPPEIKLSFQLLRELINPLGPLQRLM
ncbi:MAG TPA: hypothetical protein DCE00_01970 [Firmicutes bacterium]|jgi:hypothetical protein|nr:DUF3298 and DUF4163 domain-containing protein [Bacillota bacterium]HAA37620.1 hypothetical protein [Bacillota bacterium]